MSNVPSVVERFDLSDDLVLLVLDNLVWPVLFAVFIGFSLLLSDSFFTVRNLRFLLFSSAALGTLVLAESICLLSGHFDLSIGSIAGFSAMFTALFMAQWFPTTPAMAGILIVVTVGGVIGLLNGISIAFFDVNPFLQTLAFLIIFQGATIALSSYPVTDLPDLYMYIGGGELIEGVPVAVLVLLGLFVIAWALLKYHPVGLSIYAVGGNEDASRDAGINTKQVVVTVYVISGMLAGVSGLLYTGFLGGATPSLGDNALFPAFAGAVIGGISIFGGRGNILGALGGVLVLGTIQAGLVMLQIGPTIIRMTNGIILLAAILLYTGIEKYRRVKLQV